MQTQTMWKIAGVFAAAVPVLLLLVFAIGEGASGMQHYIELAPLMLLMIFGWYSPRPAGFVLVFGGIALMLMYAISAKASSISAPALVELLLFAPIVISGFCFLKADSQAR